MNVQQIMSRDVQCCEPEHALDCAAKIMWERDVGVVPIVDAEQRVVGIITDRDICMAAYTQGKRLFEIKVGEIMSKQITVARPSDSLTRAEELMRSAQVRRIPVVDDAGKLVGLLSQNDLIRESIRGARTAKQEVSADEVARVLNDIGRPRRDNASENRA